MLCICCLVVKAQQEPHFTQNMHNHMTVNPAFAGLLDCWNVAGIYRNQWLGMPGAPKTYALNVDGPVCIKGMKGGIALNLLNDKLGVQHVLHLMFNYSYKLRLNIGTLGMGVKFGIVNEKIGSDYFIPDDEYHTNIEDDPAINQENLSKLLFDMGLGCFLAGKSFYAGFSLAHLTKPAFTIGETGVFFLAPTLHVSGGYTWDISSSWGIQPSCYIMTDFISSQYSMNVNVIFRQMYWGGISYRYEDAVSFMGGIELKNGIMVGYSYDWNISDVGKYVGGSHEVTFSYSFDLALGKRQKVYRNVRFL